ncbi:uncharacterized protein LOC119356068 [Triticum dicoccoides]|uniref:uncharacterized protein LOC119356068 n=1 Tax=Triticum dicoccoides TaxID=85692 RepID=UPI00188E77C5|nr:uncharacterized protein LOC119356068 [Triticum dicoccoides]
MAELLDVFSGAEVDGDRGDDDDHDDHDPSKPAAALHPDHCRPPSQALQSGATETPLQTTSGDHPPPPNVFPHHHPSRELPPRPGLLPTSFTREPSGDPSSTSSTPGSGASTLLASSSAFPRTALPSLLPCSNHENLTGLLKCGVYLVLDKLELQVYRRLVKKMFPKDTLLDGDLDDLQAAEGLQDLLLSWWSDNVMRLVW